MNKKGKKQKLRTYISTRFIIIVFITILVISVCANLLINQQFKRYSENQHREYAAQMASSLSSQYNIATGEWNVDYIHGFGMFALDNGYIIRLYDKAGSVIWDAENHDMTLCHNVM